VIFDLPFIFINRNKTISEEDPSDANRTKTGKPLKRPIANLAGDERPTVTKLVKDGNGSSALAYYNEGSIFNAAADE
jgi:hypothetical protein